jgi:PAS domain-containing protein
MDDTYNRIADEARRAQPMDRARLADAILSSALDCIVVSDDQGRIVEFNQTAERTFGWSAAEILGRTMEDTIVPPFHREAPAANPLSWVAGSRSRRSAPMAASFRSSFPSLT